MSVALAGLALTGAPIAHRGLWRTGGCPENSLAAFDAACAAGYGIELDVQLTADGEAVVFHDDGLDRMTAQSGLLEEHTADALGRIKLLGGCDQFIPTLGQALALIAGRSAVLIELKTPAGQEGLLEARVAEALSGYAGPAAALSFNVQALAWLAGRHPHIPCGLNAKSSGDLQALNELRPDFLSIQMGLANEPQVSRWRAGGRPVIAWTVRRPADRQALAGKADNIIFESFVP